MRCILMCMLHLLLAISGKCSAAGINYDWYTEGDFEPETRVKVVFYNSLGFDRNDCPVVITRDAMPYPNIDDIWITVVDPELPPNPEPSPEQLKKVGGWLPRKETHGHYLHYQLDDIDKDGIWNELFFMIDIEAHETKTIYLYIKNPDRPFVRGLYEHETHGGIANYSRHLVPWWESKYMGWKLAYPTDVDLYAKREPMLVAYEEYTKNLSGYNVPYEHGSDILMVADTFGAGGVCLFESPAKPDSVSRPRFSPFNDRGQYYSTRYSFDVVINGPLRSMIRAHTMNWRTGSGLYELEQYYTAYRNKSYSTCRVKFLTFLPEEHTTEYGCGIRQIMNEYDVYREGGTIVSMGKDVVIESPSPDELGEEKTRLIIDFEGIALVVKDEYNPRYQFTEGFGGNHTFCIPVSEDKSFEYLIAGAWSEGTVNKTPDEFKDYVKKAALGFNNPLMIKEMKVEHKSVR